jgi:hypothetical protein
LKEQYKLKRGKKRIEDWSTIIYIKKE